MTTHHLAGACALVCLGVGCNEQLAPQEPAGRLEVRVAPLTLPGIDFACFDLRVEGAPGVVVWTEGDPLLTRHGNLQTNPPTVVSGGAGDGSTICSDTYGNAAGGDITYIGTCDSTSDSFAGRTGVQNRVTLWVDGLYKAGPLADIGAWQDPCPNGCSLEVDCVENADTLALFDLTVMRAANQGFFDIAVNFDDIFCSAKLDTCYDATTQIKLLHGADEERDWTAVFAFACTAGPTRAGQVTAPNTNLMLSKAELSCPGVTFELNPRLAEGNQSVTTNGTTLHYGIYRGVETLDCGLGAGSCNKKFWNLAVSLKDLDDAFVGACTLSLHATANDLNDSASTFTDGRPTGAGVSYPYVTVDVDLLDQTGVPTCQKHALNGPTQGVTTEYFGNTVGAESPVAMCHQYSGASLGGTGGVGCSSRTYVPTGTFGQPGVGTNRIRVFDGAAVGNAQPIQVIQSNALGFPGWCQVSGDELYVGNVNGQNILVFDKNANGTVAPIRTISGSGSSTSQPYGIFIEGGELFVSQYAGSAVHVFPQGANGFTAPSRTLTHTSLGQSNGVFVGGGELFTAREGTNGYAVHPRAAFGNTAATRTVAGTSRSRGIWATETEVFVGTVEAITVYARNADGAPAALRTIPVSAADQIVVKNGEITVATNEGILTFSMAGVLLRTLNTPSIYGVCVD